MISVDHADRALERPAVADHLGDDQPDVEGQDASVGRLVVCFGADPRTELVASWHGTGDMLEVMPPGRDRWALRPSVSVDGSTGVRRCRVAIEDLEPGSTYRLRVVESTSDRRSSASWVATAPDRRASFRFTAFGDHGLTPEAHRAAALVAAARPSFHLHPGDLAYANVDGDERSRIEPSAWSQWSDLLAERAPGVPWLTVPGNHDTDGRTGADAGGRVPSAPSPGYGGLRGWLPRPGAGPAGAEGAFSLRFGSVGVVGLDGNLVSREYLGAQVVEPDVQTPWLREVLADLRGDPAIDLIVVMVHHCAFASDRMHGSDAGLRSTWSPLFDEHGVDLVLSGHNHGYERTEPVDHTGRVRAGAPTYVTVGCGGQVTTRADRGRDAYRPDASVLWTESGAVVEAAPWSVIRRAVDAVLVADVDVDGSGSTLSCRVSSLEGELIDRFVISSRR